MQKRELVCGDENSWLFGGQWVDVLSHCYFLLSPQISVLCPRPHFELVVLLTISVKNKAIRGVLP